MPASLGTSMSRQPLFLENLEKLFEEIRVHDLTPESWAKSPANA
jgi:hypothetical protein